MRSTKFTLPFWVAGGLLATGTILAAEQTIPSRIDPRLYDSYAQAEAPGGTPPVMANVPQEDAYQLRGLPPQEAAAEVENAPNRYLETQFLKDRGIATYGWVDAGIGGNAWGAPWNGPITFNDRNWQGQMNQLYLVNEKVLDTEDGGADWGGRIDLLYGTDFIYTTARGLDGNLSNSVVGGAPSWASNKYYGLALPQMYGNVGYDNNAVKFGHFYTIIGYEVVPSIGNFFYTHAYTMQYGEPFTHTGVLDTWTPNDQMTVYAGITNGWDNYSDPINIFGPISNTAYPGYNSNAAFLGGVTFKNSDKTQSLSITTSSGNELSNFATNAVGNRSIFSTVYSNELSDKVTYVLQNDNGWQFNANPSYQTANPSQPGTAQWYGINQYLFYNFNESLVGGFRMEWFRDNNGTRVITPIRDAVVGQPYASGFAGNFWAMTWGLNWRASKNVMIRPELRYDWFAPDQGAAASGLSALPYGRNNDQYGQLYGGCDAIFQF